MKSHDFTNSAIEVRPDYQLIIARSAMVRIRDYLGRHPAERGGMLGGDKDGVIRHFMPDVSAKCSSGSYDPDVAAMNRWIKEWKKKSIFFRGFVHSHPPGFKQLSFADKEYGEAILAAFPSLERLDLPLVMTIPDSGQFKLLPFVAVTAAQNRNRVHFHEAALVVVAGGGVVPRTKCKDSRSTKPNRHSVNSAEPIHAPLDESDLREDLVVVPRQGSSAGTKVCMRYYGSSPFWWRITSALLDNINAVPLSRASDGSSALTLDAPVGSANHSKSSAYLDRVQTAYDLPRLDATRLLIVGAGGAACFIRDCARTGIGEFVVLDHDDISASNVGTQSVDPSKIGLSKVDVLAEDIRAINPEAAVVAVKSKIEDISDAEFELLAHGPLRATRDNSPEVSSSVRSSFKYPAQPANVILVVLTDSFEAQARGHRLGLQFGFPTICAQEYTEGRGAEVTYTVPGVTPACHRCITASRYRAYLAEGYRNTVTSHGAPIFGAQMLNAVIGHIVLAVAHHGSGHGRFGQVVSRLGNRNLILIRMDPDFDDFIGWPAFSRPLTGANNAEAFFMLDSVFLAQTSDCGQTESRPVCPDCGGKGDLRLAIGTFEDTRIMRPEKSSR